MTDGPPRLHFSDRQPPPRQVPLRRYLQCLQASQTAIQSLQPPPPPPQGTCSAQSVSMLSLR